MEKIELRAKDAPAGFKHLYVVYTNDLGREFIVRAGPGPASVLDNIDVTSSKISFPEWIALILPTSTRTLQRQEIRGSCSEAPRRGPMPSGMYRQQTESSCEPISMAIRGRISKCC